MPMPMPMPMPMQKQFMSFAPYQALRIKFRTTTSPAKAKAKKKNFCKRALSQLTKAAGRQFLSVATCGNAGLQEKALNKTTAEGPLIDAAVKLLQK